MGSGSPPAERVVAKEDPIAAEQPRRARWRCSNARRPSNESAIIEPPTTSINANRPADEAQNHIQQKLTKDVTAARADGLPQPISPGCAR